MYAFESLSLDEISKQINLSRPSVSRRLSEGTKEGIVQIYIDEASSSSRVLAD